jgi:hypothetical protein
MSNDLAVDVAQQLLAVHRAQPLDATFQSREIRSRVGDLVIKLAKQPGWRFLSDGANRFAE